MGREDTKTSGGWAECFFFSFLFLMCMSVFLISLCTMCTPRAQGGQKKALAPQDQSCRWLCTIMRVLRAEQVLLIAETVLQPRVLLIKEEPRNAWRSLPGSLVL